MKIFKPILAIFSVLVAVILVACSNANSSSTSSSSSTSGATARTLEEIKESGTVKIGVFSDKKPFGYVDANGE
ncbi:polar amino acid ABC uptake transporter substrate binding protein [Streptococcus suis]|nr:polar amino acid ABC uptake transporter substrate binding protein [Streptococcus suis]CYW14156.1 polar amino acid ABC uptake transporter substrate binding protein [Streptococcus suis]